MNRLNRERRAAVVRALVEGCSIRSTVRMTGVAKNTVAKLLVDLGSVCGRFQDENLRSLSCQKVQVDEIWSFVGSKQANVPEDRRGEFGIGDIWTWTAICADTKLVPCWLAGGRDSDYAVAFVHDLAGRLANRVQLTTDGHRPYLVAVADAFGESIDYAMLIKQYGPAVDGARRYSPPRCVGCETQAIMGNPDPAHVSTSYVERQNLTMRMMMRRFTRLTNAFSKKVENHEAAIALHFMHYNFVRTHQTLRTTSAVAAGVVDRAWTIDDVIGLLERDERDSN